MNFEKDEKSVKTKKSEKSEESGKSERETSVVISMFQVFFWGGVFIFVLGTVRVRTVRKVRKVRNVR